MLILTENHKVETIRCSTTDTQGNVFASVLVTSHHVINYLIAQHDLAQSHQTHVIKFMSMNIYVIYEASFFFGGNQPRLQGKSQSLLLITHIPIERALTQNITEFKILTNVFVYTINIYTTSGITFYFKPLKCLLFSDKNNYHA